MNLSTTNEALANALQLMATRIVALAAAESFNEAEVRAIITDLIADSSEAVDGNNNTALMTPKAVDIAAKAIWAASVGAAPETLDTIAELAAALQNNPDVISSLQSLVADNAADLLALDAKWQEDKELHNYGEDFSLHTAAIASADSTFFLAKPNGTYSCSGLPSELGVSSLLGIDTARVAHIVVTSAPWDGITRTRLALTYTLKQGDGIWMGQADTAAPGAPQWVKVGEGTGDVTKADLEKAILESNLNLISAIDRVGHPANVIFIDPFTSGLHMPRVMDINYNVEFHYDGRMVITCSDPRYAEINGLTSYWRNLNVATAPTVLFLGFKDEVGGLSGTLTTSFTPDTAVAITADTPAVFTSKLLQTPATGVGLSARFRLTVTNPGVAAKEILLPIRMK